MGEPESDKQGKSNYTIFELNMRARNWTATTADYIVNKRAGGRRAYNRRRRFLLEQRRLRVSQLLSTYSMIDRGTRARIAEILGVHPGTISRDIKALLKEVNEQRSSRHEEKSQACAWILSQTADHAKNA